MLCLFQSFFGIGEVLIGLLELLLEKESALPGLGDGEVLRQIAELIDVAVGQVGSAARIVIFNRDVDQTIFAAVVNGCIMLKPLARIGEVPFAVFLHQAEVLDHRIFDSAAFEHSHVHVVGVLEQAASAAGQRGHLTQCAKLRGQLAAQRRVLLRRQQRHRCRVAYR